MAQHQDGATPILKHEQLAVIGGGAGQVHHVDIDIVEDPDIAKSASVTGTPTVQIFRNQSLLQEFQGSKGKQDYRQTPTKLLITQS